VTRWLEVLADVVLEGPSLHVVALDDYFSPKLDVRGVAQRRRMDPQRVAALERRFYHALREQENAADVGGSSMYYTCSQFEGVASAWIPPALCRRIFKALATPGRPGWTVCDFVEAMTGFVHGGPRDSERLLLRSFSANGQPDPPTLEQAVILLTELRGHLEFRAASLGQRGAVGDDLSCLGYAPGVRVEDAAAALCKEAVGGLSGWLEGHDGRRQLLRDLALVAAAEFGIRPATPLQVRTKPQERAWRMRRKPISRDLLSFISLFCRSGA